MTAETITDTVKHIFRFFIPPILNLLIIMVVVGEGLGVEGRLHDLVHNFDSAKEIVSTYTESATKLILTNFFVKADDIGKLSDSIAKLNQDSVAKLNLDSVAKFNLTTAVQNIVTDLTLLAKFASFLTMVLFIFFAFAVDRFTLAVSKFASNVFSLLSSFVFKSLSSKLSKAIPEIIAKNISRIVAAYRRQLSSHERYARKFFAETDTVAEAAKRRGFVAEVVRAWLSQNARDSFWLSEHNNVYERSLNWRLTVDYARVYLTLSVLLICYLLILYHTVRARLILFAIMALLAFLLSRLMYNRSVVELREADLKEFFYFTTAAKFQDASGRGAKACLAKLRSRRWKTVGFLVSSEL